MKEAFSQKGSPKTVVVHCSVCKRDFEIDPEKSLKNQVPFPHTWGKGEYSLKHATKDEWFEALCEEFGYAEAQRMIEHES